MKLSKQNFEIERVEFNGFYKDGFKAEMPHGSKKYTFIYAKMPAIFSVGERKFNAKSESFIIYDKNTPQYYHAEENFVCDIISFDVRDDSILRNSGVPLDKVIKIRKSQVIPQLAQIIRDEFYSGVNRNDDFIDNMMNCLLLKLSQLINETPDISESMRHYNSLVNLRKKIYSYCRKKWTVEMMCSETNLSRSYFQKIYRDTFGISCIADVILARIELAKQNLLCTSFTVSKIAEMCGYENYEHFMRQFKQITGLTPSEYRSSNR